MVLDVKNRVATVLTRKIVITWTEIVTSDVMPVCMVSNVIKVFNYVITKVYTSVYYHQIHLCFTLILVCKIDALILKIFC